MGVQPSRLLDKVRLRSSSGLSSFAARPSPASCRGARRDDEGAMCFDVPDGELEKALAELRETLPASPSIRSGASRPPGGDVLDPLPDEGLGNLERCLVSGEDEGRVPRPKTRSKTGLISG